MLDQKAFIANFCSQFEEPAPSINLNTIFRNLDGWDSMTALMIIAMLDEEYGYQIDPEKFKSINLVGELYELIK
jgi:acyl carrier protein